MQDQPSSDPGLVLIVIKAPRISHLFCPDCDVVDQEEGRKETPYCGFQKEGPWRNVTKLDVCLVCEDLCMSECPRCIREGRA